MKFVPGQLAQSVINGNVYQIEKIQGKLVLCLIQLGSGRRVSRRSRSLYLPEHDDYLEAYEDKDLESD